MSHILEVQVYSRGKEVYGLSYPKSEFNQKKFLEDHEDDYYELSDESLESEVPVEGSYIYVSLDGKEICNEEHKDGFYCKGIKVVDSEEVQSYSDLLSLSEDDIGVMWIHDYVNTQYYTWENIDEFDPTKLCVYSMCRIDEIDGSRYSIVHYLLYDGRAADNYNIDGEPKSGYDGPYVISSN